MIWGRRPDEEVAKKGGRGGDGPAAYAVTGGALAFVFGGCICEEGGNSGRSPLHRRRVRQPLRQSRRRSPRGGGAPPQRQIPCPLSSRPPQAPHFQVPGTTTLFFSSFVCPSLFTFFFSFSLIIIHVCIYMCKWDYLRCGVLEPSDACTRV